MAHRAEAGFPFAAYTGWRAATPVISLLAKWWVKLERRGPGVPRGPAVVAANHYSHVDPVAVGIAVQRPIRYLAVDELYGNSWLFDRLTHWLGAIPMSRTRAPLGALRTSLAELEAGGAVGVFPEGVRVWTWGERAPKRGAAWLAYRTGASLYPVAIAGTDEVMGRGSHGIARRPVITTVCEPILPGDYRNAGDPLAAMMATWTQRIDDALNDAYESLGS